jgi:hypothetical protein
MRTYRLYATGTASTNNAASIQIVKAGRIKGIRFSPQVDSVVDGSALYAEISLQAAAQATTNNSQGVLATMRTVYTQATSGATLSSLSTQFLLDCPVGLGEMVYLNTVIAGTLTHSLDVFVDVQEGG